MRNIIFILGIFLAVFLIPVNAVGSGADIAVELQAISPPNPTVFDSTVFETEIANVGSVNLVIKSYYLSVEYLDANCDSICINGASLVHCSDSCGQIEVGETIKLNPFEFIPVDHYFTGGPAGSYKFMFSAEIYEVDQNILNNTASVYEEYTNLIALVSPDDDPYLGDINAQLRLIAFGSFPGPFSKKFHDEILPVLTQDYLNTGEVLYVYRDFPHAYYPEAFPAAIASECADAQSKYWPYHDLLFANNLYLGDENYIKWANDLGLDINIFVNCLDSPEVYDEVNHDINDGLAAGVDVLPTLYFQNLDCQIQTMK